MAKVLISIAKTQKDQKINAVVTKATNKVKIARNNHRHEVLIKQLCAGE